MPDFRVSDTAPEHPKLRAAGLAAAGLWSMAGGWSMQPTQLTDGWIPAYWVTTWPGGARAARRLVEVGLWIEDKRNGVPGWQYHDWADYQRTRANVEDEKRKARDRMDAIRKRRSTTSSRTVRPNNGVTEGERSPNVHDSLTLTHTQGLSGEEPSPLARAGEPPTPRCPEHINEPAAGPCGKCGDARRARAGWEAGQAEQRDQLAEALDRARADPRLRCSHGTDGGNYVRPDTGTSPCALCRTEQAAGVRA